MIIEEYDDYEEYDPNEYGATEYEAKAYYSPRYSGLAYSETFPNMDYELNEWVWEMAQRGFYVVVYDYEDGNYSYYKWPENAEYMDLSSIEDIETDERGNFLNIEDI